MKQHDVVVELPTCTILDDGSVILVGGKLRLHNCHPARQCVGQNCTIHSPSKHPLRAMDMWFNQGAGIVERVCEHGRRHPDPDSYQFVHTLWQTADEYHANVLGQTCDGCCP